MGNQRTFFFAELGLVDKAKAVVDKWMARWIDVVSFFWISRVWDRIDVMIHVLRYLTVYRLIAAQI
ncbi:hypothetical protein B0T17DRAFT_517937 [Bombardia bombarda]|uniref:Uncharacterized protein n=1 Tax=Bombardia bombarda TaxID=252184 RepID=A0AA40CEP8_9PEZI|nr:hypothetical protein B0T17DRAFT_517937 [Bombardia bombarda]